MGGSPRDFGCRIRRCNCDLGWVSLVSNDVGQMPFSYSQDEEKFSPPF